MNTKENVFKGRNHLKGNQREDEMEMREKKEEKKSE